jgi:putative DNA primase/helicase
MAVNRLLRAALKYAEILGVPVFPVHGVEGNRCDCGRLDCHSPGKHPHTARGLLDATTDPLTINEWWQRWPNANVAMPTGVASLYFVLDIDLPAGDESLQKLIEQHGDLPIAPVSVTGSGGRQVFFGYPVDPEIRNSAGKLGPNLDIRGNGGYVVLPPSLHVSGKRYAWQPDRRIEALGMVEAPAWLIEACMAPEPPGSPATSDEAITEGSRNTRLYRLARSLRAKGLSREGVTAAVRAENAAKCKPPLDAGEVEEILRNAFKQPHRVDFAPQAHGGERVALASGAAMGVAKAFTKRYIERPDGRILHRWDEQFWLWNGSYYEAVTDEDVRASIWKFLDEDAALTNKDGNPVAPTSRLASDVLDALRAHLNLPLLKHTPPCWIAKLPTDIENDALVPVKNGLLHLSTGELADPNPRWFCHWTLKTDYEPEAACPEWRAFLEDIWPDQQSRDTLQEIFGYLLTPDNRQQKAFMIIGPPRSGKGTIGRVLAALLGSDAVGRPAMADFGYQFGLESLIGKSVAIISDARLDGNISAAMLAERLLAISGEDSINVARKFRGTWHGELHVRFLFLANELPRFRDASGALPHRFVILKTTQSYLGKEDPTLYARLVAEMPGILNWAIEGWMRLQERGCFVQPDMAEDMVDQLKIIANPLGMFLEEVCIVDQQATTTMSDLYKCYLQWSKGIESRPLPVTLFGRDLRAALPSLRFSSREATAHGRRTIHGIAPDWTKVAQPAADFGWK